MHSGNAVIHVRIFICNTTMESNAPAAGMSTSIGFQRANVQISFMPSLSSVQCDKPFLPFCESGSRPQYLLYIAL